MKRVRKIADDFARSMGINTLPIELKQLEKIVEVNNWKIVTYSKGYNFIKAESLENYYYTSKGFTYSSSEFTIIFIKDNLEYLDKINTICHEIGHIVLKHIEVGSKQKSNTINAKDNIQELEADVFAIEMQAPDYLMQQLRITTPHALVDNGIFTKENAKLRIKYYISDIYFTRTCFNVFLIIATSIITVFVTIAIIKNNYNITENTVNNTPIETISEITSDTVITNNYRNETVYITKTGDKYHKPNCFYIRGRKALTITLSEAENQGYLPCSACFNK